MVGSWTVDAQSVGFAWSDSISILDARGGHVAHLTRGYEGNKNDDGCPSFSNARVMAASRDLLEAVLELGDEHWTLALQAAVEKATGWGILINSALGEGEKQ